MELATTQASNHEWMDETFVRSFVRSFVVAFAVSSFLPVVFCCCGFVWWVVTVARVVNKKTSHRPSKWVLKRVGKAAQLRKSGAIKLEKRCN